MEVIKEIYPFVITVAFLILFLYIRNIDKKYKRITNGLLYKKSNKSAYCKKEKPEHLNEMQMTLREQQKLNKEYKGIWICPVCSRKNSYSTEVCSNCGEILRHKSFIRGLCSDTKLKEYCVKCNAYGKVIDFYFNDESKHVCATLDCLHEVILL